MYGYTAVQNTLCLNIHGNNSDGFFLFQRVKTQACYFSFISEMSNLHVFKLARNLSLLIFFKELAFDFIYFLYWLLVSISSMSAHLFALGLGHSWSSFSKQKVILDFSSNRHTQSYI